MDCGYDDRHDALGSLSEENDSGSDGNRRHSDEDLGDGVEGDDDDEFDDEIDQFRECAASIGVDLGDEIAVGNFGRVFCGVLTDSNETRVCVKFLKEQKSSRAKFQLLNFQREVNLMRGLNHRNILPFVDSSDGPPQCIVTLFMENGNLFDWIHGDRRNRMRICRRRRRYDLKKRRASRRRARRQHRRRGHGRSSRDDDSNDDDIDNSSSSGTSTGDSGSASSVSTSTSASLGSSAGSRSCDDDSEGYCSDDGGDDDGGDEGVERAAFEAVLLDVAKAMRFLHSFDPPIVHRDLTSPNVLIDANGVGKVSDFGLAKIKNPMLEPSGQRGNLAWIAPEAVFMTGFEKPCDVYSFGVVLWEVVTREVPYTGKSAREIRNSKTEGRLPGGLPPDCAEDMEQLLRACLDNDPSHRPTFVHIVEFLIG